MYRIIVAYVLSGEAASIVNELRERLDPKASARIPAHLTLAGPFEVPQLDQTFVDAIARVARSIPPIPFTLRGFASFLPMTCTTFACVQQPSLIVTIHNYLLRELVWTERYEYSPHVTVTEYLDEAATSRVSDQLRDTALLVRDTITELSLMVKDTTNTWRCAESFPLVGAESAATRAATPAG